MKKLFTVLSTACAISSPAYALDPAACQPIASFTHTMSTAMHQGLTYEGALTYVAENSEGLDKEYLETSLKALTFLYMNPSAKKMRPESAAATIYLACKKLTQNQQGAK